MLLISIIVGIAALAAATALYITFVSAILTFFDYVIKGIKKLYRAIKVYVKKKNSNKVDGRVIVETEDGLWSYSDTTKIESIDKDELDDDILEKLESAKPTRNGEQMVEAIITEEAKQELKERNLYR